MNFIREREREKKLLQNFGLEAKKKVQKARKNREIKGIIIFKKILMNWTVPILHQKRSGRDETPATRSCKEKLRYKLRSQNKRATMY
jgi:hypothetical protein